jgi:hypothetical protein
MEADGKHKAQREHRDRLEESLPLEGATSDEQFKRLLDRSTSTGTASYRKLPKDRWQSKTHLGRPSRTLMAGLLREEKSFPRCRSKRRSQMILSNVLVRVVDGAK